MLVIINIYNKKHSSIFQVVVLFSDIKLKCWTSNLVLENFFVTLCINFPIQKRDEGRTLIILFIYKISNKHKNILTFKIKLLLFFVESIEGK